jgi:SAM-dependent methyltransferase
VDVNEPKQTVAGLFGRAAAGYDQVGFFHQVAQRLLALAGVGQGMRVLDVACGSGAVLVQAARLAGPAGLAVGVDLAEPMVAVAARQLQPLAQGRGAVAVMDAERLGLRPAGSTWPAAVGRREDSADAGRAVGCGLRRRGAWWAQQRAHGERRPLEQMNPGTLAAYRAAAFAAIEACREADGALHWRPEVIYAIASM